MHALTINETYQPYGVISEMFTLTDPEIILAGPAGTGKSRGILELLNYNAMTYPNSRQLIVRKTRRSLTESAMVTLEQKVLHSAQRVKFKSSVQQYQYPSPDKKKYPVGSVIAVGGMDKPEKILSSEWDLIYAQECTELDENDWEMCSMRLRNGVLPNQMIIGDCNAGPSTHWIKGRERDGRTLVLTTRHEDNPMLFNADGTRTKEGERYLSRLDELTGVRRARYWLGLWVSAEGMIFEDSWNAQRNLVYRFDIPKEWARYLAVDFGYTNPFVCQWWAEDPDGRLFRYREIYKTKTLVEDHAKEIRRLSRWGENGGDPFPRAIICDHDAEDRATLERHLGLRTTAAKKTVSDGIQAVASRLKPAGDGKPRVAFFRDALVERDRDLAQRKKPTCFEEEVEGYVWMQNSQGIKEEPVKEDDHGADCTRYMVAHKDLVPNKVTYSNRVY